MHRESKPRAARALQAATVAVFCLLVAGFGVATAAGGVHLVASGSAEAESYVHTVQLGPCTVGLDFKDESAMEKRELAQFPVPTLAEVADGTFQEQFEAFLEDQFAGRDAWVTLKTAFEVRVLGKTESNDIYIGSGGYLIEKYTDADFEEDQVAENVEALAAFANMVSGAMGPDAVRVVMVPGKANALPSYLPAYAQSSTAQQEMKDALCAQLDNADSVFLDLTETLQAHEDEYIYYRTDHHWTTLGAYYGYEQIMASLGTEVDAYESYEPEAVTSEFLGTSYNNVHYATQADEITRIHTTAGDAATMVIDDSGDIVQADSIYDEDALAGDDPYTYFMSGNYGQITVHTGCANGKTLFIVKDSYANCLVPYLAEQYETIVMLDVRYLNDNVSTCISNSVDALDENVNILILFNEEKFMQDTHSYLLN